MKNTLQSEKVTMLNKSPEQINWGIIGCGGIANAFAIGLTFLPDAKLLAVASRSKERAAEFAARHSVERSYGSYAELIADDAIDIVYIATPNTMHQEHALLVLSGGKAVLCEKPMTTSRADTEAIIASAQAQHLFCMEAHWSRFSPLLQKLHTMIADGGLGEVRRIAVDFGYNPPYDPAHRVFNPELGGGALFDVGCYCLSLLAWFLGEPQGCIAAGKLFANGVDASVSWHFSYSNGIIADGFCSTETATRQGFEIDGTNGTIISPDCWWRGQGEARHIDFAGSGSRHTISADQMIGNGYNYEAAEAIRCLRAGLIQSPVMPHADSILIASQIDTILQTIVP